MTDPTVSAVIAVFAGFVLAGLLAVPYIAASYRRRGELGLWRVLLVLGFLVYAMSLWTYTLLPIPQTTAAWCAEHAASHLQPRPFQFLADIRREQSGSGLRAFLRNPAVQQAVFNVALFVPLGMFVRHLFRRSFPATVAIGFAVSLFIECTQLTGVWFLFECPYRLADVDDLLTNTLGAAVGFGLAPLLRLLPGNEPSAPPGIPRPVTARRRLLGMAVDVVSVVLLGTTVGLVTTLLVGQPGTVVTALIGTLLPAMLLLLVVPLAGNGATFGQRVVLLRPVGPDGGKPAGWRTLVRFLAGSGGYFTLLTLASVVNGGFEPLANLLFFASGMLAIRPQDHQGLSGILAGLRVVDARTIAGSDEPPGVVDTNGASGRDGVGQRR
ncbi:VanZ family protein [Amycolatopsis regifaucium]|uniref:Antibiotic resistance protein VanZ n=1 Tax=Amycolatopsis regifaucium TaxID=546365 RepID=A0A154MXI0_9PSEU|nr:VanZ family protein [Amycolatopsis regifaucium]KZB88663.1 antibiotic resistance protein VanZ [Amycolatopsis regifaucium]OKA07166.1 antibiotic resistance protein VanZ [Amycolatopsis regifaucium]SFI55605.1 Glycopeptide antibiotics resistance protein [Amycolatopsis regifaucium]